MLTLTDPVAVLATPDRTDAAARLDARRVPALSAVQAKKWVRGSADRDALIAIYDRLFSSIENQMR